MPRPSRPFVPGGAALAAALLAGCGTPYATVPDGQGRPVMLLGFDPVAYPLQGAPQRGDAALAVELPGRTDCFVSVEHRDRCVAEPARWEPQDGGFCASGAQIRAERQARHPGQTWPADDPGGLFTNLFVKPPGWRAAEGFGQPALGYPR